MYYQYNSSNWYESYISWVFAKPPRSWSTDLDVDVFILCCAYCCYSLMLPPMGLPVFAHTWLLAHKLFSFCMQVRTAGISGWWTHSKGLKHIFLNCTQYSHEWCTYTWLLCSTCTFKGVKKIGLSLEMSYTSIRKYAVSYLNRLENKRHCAWILELGGQHTKYWDICPLKSQ